MAKKQNGEGSTRQLSDGSWECIVQSKYLNPDTNKPKRIKRKAKTEKEAVKTARMALLAWEKSFEEGLNEKVDKKKTFGQYMEEFIEEEVKPNITASAYKSYTYAMRANFFNYKISKLQLHQLNKVEFEIFFDTIIHDKSEKTASFPIQLCKRCCKYLVGKSLLEENYAEYARTKKEKKDEFFRKEETEIRKEIFSNEDIIKFYNSYKNGVSEYSSAVILILETLIRGQELLCLTIDDLDFEKNIIHIRSAVSDRFIDNDKTKGLEYYIKVPKNSNERIVYMTPLAKEVLYYMIEQARMKCRENPMNLVFPSYLKNGKMRSMDAFEMQLKQLCDKLGIDRDVRTRTLPNGKVVRQGLSVHALRHTAITLANTAKDSNVINTALMAGHTAIRTENIYTHANIDALKTVKTAGDLVLNLNDKNAPEQSESTPNENVNMQELYEIYQKLKAVFEENEG